MSMNSFILEWFDLGYLQETRGDKYMIIGLCGHSSANEYLPKHSIPICSRVRATLYPAMSIGQSATL